MDRKWIFQSRGRPVFVLGGQVHNSSAYSREELETGWRSLEAMGANTIEVPVYWDKVEPLEGSFNFSMVDYILEGARARGLYVILLWFASWKNGHMKYCPVWVKRDRERFRRTLNSDMLPTSTLSSHCKANLEADRKAFVALMSHVKKVDAERQTVLAIQVENEPGTFGHTTYDHGPDGFTDFMKDVPDEVIEAVSRETGGSEHDAWVMAGRRTKGNWSEMFGRRGGDLMSAYSLATYINAVAEAGKAVYDIPMYVNVWLDHQQWDQPGLGYLAGSPVTRNLRLWKALTPSIDMLCPDLYPAVMDLYTLFCGEYSRKDNPLFIPESGAHIGNAMNTMRAIAEYGLQGVAYFGVEDIVDIGGNTPDRALPGVQNFHFLRSILPAIIKYQPMGRITALYQKEFSVEQYLEFEDFVALVTFDSNPMAHYPRIRESRYDWHNRDYEASPPRGRGLLIRGDDGAVYICGAGLRVSLRKRHDEGDPYSAIMEERAVNYYAVEEGYFDEDCNWVRTRVRSGDESDHAVFVTPRTGTVRVVFAEE